MKRLVGYKQIKVCSTAAGSSENLKIENADCLPVDSG